MGGVANPSPPAIRGVQSAVSATSGSINFDYGGANQGAEDAEEGRVWKIFWILHLKWRLLVHSGRYL